MSMKLRIATAAAALAMSVSISFAGTYGAGGPRVAAHTMRALERVGTALSDFYGNLSPGVPIGP